MVNRKQLDICGLHVPALNNVGEACVNHFSDIKRYVSQAALISFWWMPIATRISMCWGRSATLPSIFSRYDLIKVCKYVDTCMIWSLSELNSELQLSFPCICIDIQLYYTDIQGCAHKSAQWFVISDSNLCSNKKNYTYLKAKVVVVVITGIYNFRVKNLKRKKKGTSIIPHLSP